MYTPVPFPMGNDAILFYLAFIPYSSYFSKYAIFKKWDIWFKQYKCTYGENRMKYQKDGLFWEIQDMQLLLEQRGMLCAVENRSHWHEKNLRLSVASQAFWNKLWSSKSFLPPYCSHQSWAIHSLLKIDGNNLIFPLDPSMLNTELHGSNSTT